ncbi:MAG: hypothetical protein R3284_11035, partial [Rubricoccaceae bacterium]|nr:hypothetical protein [Rubricoccaceae bacterium]
MRKWKVLGSELGGGFNLSPGGAGPAWISRNMWRKRILEAVASILIQRTGMVALLVAIAVGCFAGIQKAQGQGQSAMVPAFPNMSPFSRPMDLEL